MHLFAAYISPQKSLFLLVYVHTYDTLLYVSPAAEVEFVRVQRPSPVHVSPDQGRGPQLHPQQSQPPPGPGGLQQGEGRALQDDLQGEHATMMLIMTQ